MRRESLFLFFWGVCVSAGMVLIGTRNPSQDFPTSATSAVRSPTGCDFIRYSPVRFRANEEPYGMEWDLCHEMEPPQNYVKIQRELGKEEYGFEPADEISRLERMDFDSDGNEELLYVSIAAGTGNHIDWCVLGWIKDGLKCWTVPNVEVPAQKLLKSDENFCCKDWSLEGCCEEHCSRARYLSQGRG